MEIKSIGKWSIYTLLLVALMLVQVLPSPAKAATIINSVTGIINNGTAGGGVKGLAVNLYIYENNVYLNKLSSTANDDGIFYFTGLSNDSKFSYEVVTTYGQVEYTTGIFQFAIDETNKKVTLNIYETTTSDAAIAISSAHIVIYPQNGDLLIKEIFIFHNSGDRTYIGSQPTGTTGHYKILKFTLPPKATGLVPTAGLDTNYIVNTDTGFIDTTPVAPGDTNKAYQYTIIKPGKVYDYSRKTDYAIEILDMLIQGTTTGFSSSKFNRQTTLDMGGKSFDYYLATGFRADDTVSFTLSGLPSTGVSLSPNFWVIIIVVVVIIILAGLLIILSRKKNPPEGWAEDSRE